MRRIIPLLLAIELHAEPILPKVAASLPLPDCRMKIAMTVTSAGSIAPPRGVVGTLELASANRFRFDSPELKAVSDGSTLWQWNASTNQVLIRTAAQLQEANLPTGILQAALAGAETGARQETLDGQSVWRLELDVTKPPLSRYAKAALWAKVADSRPMRLVVEDADGGQTSWDIRKVGRWKPTSADFTFASPRGAEAVDLR